MMNETRKEKRGSDLVGALKSGHARKYARKNPLDKTLSVRCNPDIGARMTKIPQYAPSGKSPKYFFSSICSTGSCYVISNFFGILPHGAVIN
jgi:hypothetical protein